MLKDLVTVKIPAKIVNQMKGITAGLAVCIDTQNSALVGTEPVNQN